MEFPKKFLSALKFVLKWEGGKSDHPNDPGGRTNKGITQSVYNSWRKSKGLPPKDVFEITDDEVYQIYYERYWTPLKGDEIPSPLDLVVFDSGVNCGIGRAALWLNTALSLPPKYTVTKETIEKVKSLKDLKPVMKKVCDLRENHYRTISEKNPKLKVFLKGWLNRLNDLRKTVGLV